MTLMATITLQRNSTAYVPNLQSYKVLLEVSTATGISPYVFVLQRQRTVSDPTKTDDVFAAICTPEQLESLPQDAPDADSSYFRARSVTLVSRTLENLNDVIQSILGEINKLCLDYELMINLNDAATYTITSTTITEA